MGRLGICERIAEQRGVAARPGQPRYAHHTNRDHRHQCSTWTVQFGLTLGQGAARPGQQGLSWSLEPTTAGHAAPVIVDHDASSVQGADSYALMAIMQDILSSQVLALGPTFGSIVLGDAGAATDQPWLVPTGAAFACEAYPDGEAGTGVFALLGMT
jgi:hypothetical protein